jgi:predicted PurR-regulated permease PerM
MASAPVQPPPRAQRPADGRPEPTPPPRWKGDDAVPRGLAVASAVTLRVAIVLGGVIVIALAASRLMLLVLPVIIALLLTTLLTPVSRWLQRHHWRPAPAALAATLLGVLVFFGLWALIIPGVVDQIDELIDSVEGGAGEAAGFLEPVGVGRDEVSRAVDDALSSVQGSTVADQVLSGATLLTKWAAGIVLVIVLTFFFLKDGDRLWNWVLELFHEERQPVLHEAGVRSWTALSTYVQGVFLVATIDAALIGVALLLVGVPLALPLIVLTFIAAFFPIIGAFTAGAAAVLVALVSNGLGSALIILGVIIAVQQLEGNVFYPVVVGRRMNLHPVGILLALTAGGVLAGIAGAFLAVPVAAVTAAVLDFTRERREARQRSAVIAPP